MGKTGRFVCIFTPMLLTLASLTFHIMVGLGGTNVSNSYLSNLYFMQANTTAAAQNSTLNNMPANPTTDPADIQHGKIVLKNFYAVALWGYCAGSGDVSTASKLAIGQNSSRTVDFCTARKLQFAFNPRDAWGINGTFGDKFFGNTTNNLLDNYESKSSKWISTLYILTVTAIGLEIIIGIGSLFSRLGSLVTTIAALITCSLTFSFAVLTTITYSAFVVAYNDALKSSGITFKIGPTMFAYMWLSVALSITGLFFWAFSSCCCSGRSKTPASVEHQGGNAFNYAPIK